MALFNLKRDLFFEWMDLHPEDHDYDKLGYSVCRLTNDVILEQLSCVITFAKAPIGGLETSAVGFFSKSGMVKAAKSTHT